MSDKFESLKIRILVSFITLSKESCTVTGLARLLGIEKYSVSRAISALEKEGLLTRGENRTMGLTGKGNAEARRYAGLLEAAQSCLIHEGVVFCQVLFLKKSVGIPFFQQGIFPAFSGHYASLRMRACSIR